MFPPPFRPMLTMISEDLTGNIIQEAFQILEEAGVYIENKEAYQLLREHRAEPGSQDEKAKGAGRLKLPRKMVENALAEAPTSVSLWDIPGDERIDLGGDQVHFNPGSAALYLYDLGTRCIRKPVTEDLQRFVRLVDRLPHYHLQSTALISSDVPEDCGDSYRLYLALRLGRKPVITGIFRKESFSFMKGMLAVVRGGEAELARKPLAIFDACPSPPLMWSDLTAHSVIEAAWAGIPSEFVSMPLTGSTAPVTLSGAVVQHAAETLSGVVLAQCAKPGAPVIWGGSPSAMDMRYGTTPMGAIETMMINLADVCVGKALGLPTQVYMGLSDAKRVDYQAGLESGMGLLLAALAGVNVVSGPGMLDFESCQSPEKLVLDHEICGMAYRMLEGIARRDEHMALDLLMSFSPGDHLLTDAHTIKWFRQEISVPGKSIDRRARGSDRFEDLDSAEARASQEVERIQSEESEPVLSRAVLKELDAMMKAELKKAGAEGLPA